MVANFTGVSEIALDPEEAKKLDGAIKRVMKHHQINVTQKQADVAYLAYVAASIYGPRAVAIYMNRTESNKRASPQTPDDTGNVFGFTAAG